MDRYCLTLDLKDDPTLIAEYEAWHQKVWPEIMESIRSAGIENMQIYRFANRLFMIMEVNKKFSFEIECYLKKHWWKKNFWQLSRKI